MTTYTGKGIDYFRARAVLQGCRLMQAGIKPNRGWNKTRAMALASEYTGVEYKRGQLDDAVQDLQAYVVEARRHLKPGEVQ